MKKKMSPPADLLTALGNSKIIRLRAGSGTHRFIGIWFVVVEGRVVVRSWSMKPDGWYREFLKDSRGTVQVGKAEIPIRAVPVKSTRLRNAVDRAYLEKYGSGGSLKYAKDLGTPKSRATTMELISASPKKTKAS
jgi:hypothetical protein